MLALLASVVLLAGCGSINETLRDEQNLRISRDATAPEKAHKLGSVFAWPPHASALVVDGEGNRCVRVAAGARVTGGATQAGLDIEAMKKIAQNLNINWNSAVEQAFIRLNTPSELANVLDVVLFHHCIQDANGTFKDENKWKAQETMKLYQQAMDVIKEAYSAKSPTTSQDAGTVRAGTSTLSGASPAGRGATQPASAPATQPGAAPATSSGASTPSR
jgi:hypothetical protein